MYKIGDIIVGEDHRAEDIHGKKNFNIIFLPGEIVRIIEHSNGGWPPIYECEYLKDYDYKGYFDDDNIKTFSVDDAHIANKEDSKKILREYNLNKILDE